MIRATRRNGVGGFRLGGLSARLGIIGFLGVACVAAAPPEGDPENPPGNNTEKRLATAEVVLREALGVRDKHISSEVIAKTDCLGVFPSVWKAALLIGGKYGKGFITCRLPHGGWSAPASFRIEGGNIGLQIGGISSDLVILFMTPESVDKLLRTKLTIGVDASAAGGPIGRSASASTDVLFGADILGYSRSRGVFAGISFDGATMRPFHKGNRKLYGFEPTIKSLLRGEVDAPARARPILDMLGQYKPLPEDAD